MAGEFLTRVLVCAGIIVGAAQAESPDPVQLDDVIVTAQKREQSAQTVPIPMTVFGHDFLEETGAGTIEQVARMSPNFTIAGGAQQTNNIVSIRGIGSVGNNAIESSVGVFIDGVYYPRAGSIIGQLLDIGSFEVLRGPQGTLFGRNTPVGALNITTRNPTRDTRGMVEAAYGSYDALALGGFVSGGLSDTVTGRVAFKYIDRDGYGFNTLDNRSFGERSDLVLRGKLRFDITDRLSLLATVDHGRIITGGATTELLNSTADPVFDARLIALYGSTVTTDNPYDHVIHQDHRDHLVDQQGGVSFDTRYAFANGLALRSITAWRNRQADVVESALRLPVDMLPRSSLFQTQTASQEFQLLSPGGGTFDWVAGLFLYREDYDIHQGFDAGDGYCIPTVEALLGTAQAQACLAAPQQRFIDSNFAQDLRSLALFGQGTWHMADQLALTLGYRWTRDRKNADLVQVVNNPLAVLVRVPETALDMQRRESRSTWLANLSWFPRRNTLLFATASSGFKSGGFNPEGSNSALGSERRTFGPETSLDFELGVKSTLFDGRMTANVTAFRTDIDGFQDRAFDGLSFEVRNVGKVRQQGIEADLRWWPVDPLRVVAGASYLDSEYLSFRGAPPLPGNSLPQDLTGTRKTASPAWKSSLDATWTQGLASGVNWFVAGGWQQMGRQNIGLISNNNPQSIQHAYALFNARTGLRAASGRWDLTFSGENLADTGYCTAMGDQPFGATLGAVNPARHTVVQRCIVGAPRTWTIQARWNY